MTFGVVDDAAVDHRRNDGTITKDVAPVGAWPHGVVTSGAGVGRRVSHVGSAAAPDPLTETSHVANHPARCQQRVAATLKKKLPGL